MTWFTEDPFWPLVLAACAAIIILLMMFASGRWSLWKPVAVVVVLALLLALVEHLIVTDRELIESQINLATQAALRHDVSAIESLVDPQAVQLRRQIRSELAQVRIEQLRITHQVVQVDLATNPPTAIADMIVRLSVREGKGGSEDVPPVAVKVQFRKGTGGWLVSDAEFQDLRSALGGKHH